ncbi:hypothetical protein GCM10027342_17880 [Photobacterium alginatilyticum]
MIAFVSGVAALLGVEAIARRIAVAPMVVLYILLPSERRFLLQLTIYRQGEYVYMDWLVMCCMLLHEIYLVNGYINRKLYYLCSKENAILELAQRVSQCRVNLVGYLVIMFQVFHYELGSYGI